MKMTTAIAALLLAFAALPARALVLTTWNFPENASSIDEENATQVAVLSVRRSLDETGTVVIYRTDAPGTLAASAEAYESPADGNRGGLSASFVENVTAGFSLVRAFGARGGGAPKGGGYNFSAHDEASNYDTTLPWNLGENGGSGFNAWKAMGGDDPSRDFVGAGNDKQFAIARDGDVGRTFENGVQLDSGEFTVSADHTFTADFSGFAVYGGGYDTGLTELIRWGVAKREDSEDGGRMKTGFWYATSGGEAGYCFFGNLGNDVESVSVDYQLTWTSLGNGLEFTIDASEAGGGALLASTTTRLENVAAVSGVGALALTSSGRNYLRFDNLNVEGHVVPEPGTVSLLLFGIAVLGAGRKKNAVR